MESKLHLAASNDEKKTSEVTLTLSVKELQPMIPALSKLANSNLLLGKTGYWFGRMIKDLNASLEEATKQQRKVFDAMSTLDLNGKTRSIPPEKQEEFQEKLNELADIPNEVVLRNGRFQLTLDDLTLSDPQTRKIECLLTPVEIAALDGTIIDWQGM